MVREIGEKDGDKKGREIKAEEQRELQRREGRIQRARERLGQKETLEVDRWV